MSRIAWGTCLLAFLVITNAVAEDTSLSTDTSQIAASEGAVTDAATALAAVRQARTATNTSQTFQAFFGVCDQHTGTHEALEATGEIVGMFDKAPDAQLDALEAALPAMTDVHSVREPW